MKWLRALIRGLLAALGDLGLIPVPVVPTPEARVALGLHDGDILLALRPSRSLSKEQHQAVRSVLSSAAPSQETEALVTSLSCLVLPNDAPSEQELYEYVGAIHTRAAPWLHQD